MSSTPLDVLIVDDEALARSVIRGLLEKESDACIVGECSNGEEAVRAVAALKPDLVFLDVQMPVLDGFEALARFPREHMPLVVFVTAYDEHALRAFDVHALDYLLKPYDDDRFREALDRARAQHTTQDLTELRSRLLKLLDDAPPDSKAELKTEALERIMIRSGGRVQFVSTREIHWIEAADYYVRLHGQGRPQLLRESMSSLEARLDAQRFYRVHRSAIVNLDHVQEIRSRSRGNYLVVLDDGVELKLSRSRREELKARLASG